MFLLDTHVLIECLRGRPQAHEWLARSPREAFGVPGVVAMELLMGCRDQADQHRVQKFVTQFPILWPDASEFARAYDLMAAHRLASGLGIPDCLIAATTLSRNATLYTFNLKHFQKIRELDVLEPYSRS
jgi:predicted nucleic acid-binding protein